MSQHTITLNLSTDQLTHLNDALNEHKQANIEAIASTSFQEEHSHLFKQCDALQVFIDTISDLVPEVSDV